MFQQNHREWQNDDEECAESATTSVALEHCQPENNNGNSPTNNNNGKSERARVIAPRMWSKISPFFHILLPNQMKTIFKQFS